MFKYFRLDIFIRYKLVFFGKGINLQWQSITLRIQVTYNQSLSVIDKWMLFQVCFSIKPENCKIG